MFQMSLLLILIINSMMFYNSKTPLSMGLMLLSQTLLISMISGYMSFNFWYTYIMFLIMIGGMLILFIYVSSLSSNQKFNFNKNNLLLKILIMMMFIFMMKNSNFYSTLNSDSMSIINLSFEQNYELKMSMNKLYNFPTNKIMLLIMNYLLLTLFIVVEITNINMGPLRKNF
uniref:NADH-ubiquinone oxidoreductase chain 6 n=1 Tax=Analcellicampa danfengensis TaxID=2419779 RepID=A0A7U0FPN6_9HYME|nr:NADH dehydrogenase subunit 6 [Analcellicampa danfengensis]QQV69257.1 NADH dehydrogenase subunit 6 [Analcellicampa danfengensis]